VAAGRHIPPKITRRSMRRRTRLRSIEYRYPTKSMIRGESHARPNRRRPGKNRTEAGFRSRRLSRSHGRLATRESPDNRGARRCAISPPASPAPLRGLFATAAYILYEGWLELQRRHLHGDDHVGYNEIRPINTPALNAITISSVVLGCTGIIFLTGAEKHEMLNEKPAPFLGKA
jgi:hypothetical protein